MTAMRIHFVLLFTCCLFVVNGSAQCLSGDCKNGQGRMDMGYAVYEGSFKNGEPEGTGTMDYGGGDKYTGGWHKGKEDGAGVLYKKGVAMSAFYNNGVLQTAARKAESVGGNGDWKEKVPGCIAGDCYEGYGEITFPSGNNYKGGFKDGVKSGQGEMRFASGNILKGTFTANNPVTGTFWYADVKTLFCGSFNADGTPKDGTYTASGMDAIVDITNGRVTGERHPRRDSINAIAAKHAREYGPCPYCEGKGKYLHTSYSPISSTRSEGVQRDGLGGGYINVVSYKTTGGFSQNMMTCPKCSGTGELKRK